MNLPLKSGNIIDMLLVQQSINQSISHNSEWCLLECTLHVSIKIDEFYLGQNAATIQKNTIILKKLIHNINMN